MNVREADEGDRPRMIAMGLRHIRTTPYAGFLDAQEPYISALVDRLLDDGVVAILEADDGRVVGMLCLFIVPHAVSGILIAVEASWWVDPEHRGHKSSRRMVGLAEQWAKDRGAVEVHMIAPIANPKVGRYYGTLGYEPVETTHVKRLT